MPTRVVHHARGRRTLRVHSVPRMRIDAKRNRETSTHSELQVVDRDGAEAHGAGGSRGEDDERALEQGSGARDEEGKISSRGGGKEQAVTSERMDGDGEIAPNQSISSGCRKLGVNDRKRNAEAELPEDIEREHAMSPTAERSKKKPEGDEEDVSERRSRTCCRRSRKLRLTSRMRRKRQTVKSRTRNSWSVGGHEENGGN